MWLGPGSRLASNPGVRSHVQSAVPSASWQLFALTWQRKQHCALPQLHPNCHYAVCGLCVSSQSVLALFWAGPCALLQLTAVLHGLPLHQRWPVRA